MKVLVVDDSPDIAEVVGLCFELRWPGTNILTAVDGEDALAQLEQESPGVLRRGGLVPGPLGLPGGDDQSGGEREGDEQPRHEADAVAPQIAECVVAQRALASGDREPPEMAAQILGELLDRQVSLRRLLAHRLQDDAVEIADEPASPARETS